MSDTPLYQTELKSLPFLHRGKVRDIYAVGDDMLLVVQSDRLSAFDVILDDPIPGKGRVLTEVSNFWFDRQVQGGVVTRLAQESIATLTGMPGFEALPSHNQVCQALLQHCTHPHEEVLEYLKRDVANLTLGNKDNHARNTAIQRDLNGHIALPILRPPRASCLP